MKKLFFIAILTILLNIVASAQNYNCWMHSGNDGLTHQCYSIIEMSDGNFMVDDNVFENGDDVGMFLYKVTPDGVAIDSAFIAVENFRIHSGCPRFRDPFNENSNVFTSFYNINEQGYYKALYINDDLDVVSEVEAELGIGKIGLGFRAFLNDDNDIVVHDRINDTTERFYIVGIDGETKFVSQPLGRYYEEIAQSPFFYISKNPLRYGFITMARHSNYGEITFIEEYDSEFNRIARHPITKIGQNLPSYYAENFGCYLGEESFLFTTPMPDFSSYPYKHNNVVIKYNHEFQPVAMFIFGDDYNDLLVRGNIAVTDEGRIYVVWTDLVETKYVLVVDCLDFDLNLKEEVYCIGYYKMANFGVTVRENNGLALSGWLYDSDVLYDLSKKIYAVIFDEYLLSTEISTTDKPFSCHPNPASGIISVSFDDNANCHSVEIFSLDGRLVKSQSANFNAIDISSLAPGLYVIKVRMSDGREYNERIVKE